MPIAGLTTQKLATNSLGRIDIKVYKGGRKGPKMAGKDLNEKLRITTSSLIARDALKAIYGEPTEFKESVGNPPKELKEWDFLVDSIEFYLPYDSPEKNCDPLMKKYGKNGLEIICDREYIQFRNIEKTDPNGNTFCEPSMEKEDCPVRGHSFATSCPYGCNKQGVLFFYLKELASRGLWMPAQITFTGFTDITYITQELQAIANLLGSLSQSDFFCPRYQHHVPYVLRRQTVKLNRGIQKKRPPEEAEITGEKYRRTGVKVKSTTWALSIAVLPKYLELRDMWLRMNAAENWGLRPSPDVVKGFLAEQGAIDVEVEEVVLSQQSQLPGNLDVEVEEVVLSQQSQLPGNLDVDFRQQLMKESAEFMESLEWTADMGREYLEKVFSVRSRHNLTSEQLQDFVWYLKSLSKDQGSIEGS